MDSERARCVETALGLGFGALFEEAEDFRAIVRVFAVLLAELGHGVRLPDARSLGERIRCGELLVLALADAGFRGDLHPHQVSGLDWKALSGALR